MKKIEFYFDFLSPYGYIGSLEVKKLAAKHKLIVDWNVMLLGVSVLKVMGLKPLLATPLKGDYIKKDVARLSRMLDIDINLTQNLVFNPLSSARVCTWMAMRSKEEARQFGQMSYKAKWRDGINIESVAQLTSLIRQLGYQNADAEDIISDEAVKTELRKQVDQSIRLGVFGSPSFLYRGELFWGTDRLPMLEQWIVSGGW